MSAHQRWHLKLLVSQIKTELTLGKEIKMLYSRVRQEMVTAADRREASVNKLLLFLYLPPPVTDGEAATEKK